jgi:hypothetical protein
MAMMPLATFGRIVTASIPAQMWMRGQPASVADDMYSNPSVALPASHDLQIKRGASRPTQSRQIAFWHAAQRPIAVALSCVKQFMRGRRLLRRT